MSGHDDTVIPEGYKRCSRRDKCINPKGPVLPATVEYFAVRREMRAGLKSECKVCQRKSQRECDQRHKEQRRDYSRRWEREHRAERRQYRQTSQQRQSQKEYRTRTRLHRQEYNKMYADKHKDERHEYAARYYRTNKTKIRLRVFANPGTKIWYHRRRAKRRELPNQFTPDEWQSAVSYFDGRCAVCGRLPDSTHKIVADHWIPLASPSCPGTVRENIVPLCHSLPGGTGGCNNSKSGSMPDEWVSSRYGQQESSVILLRINEYLRHL